MINEKIKGFIESPVSNDFGLSIDTIAEKCKSYGRFNSWLNQDITKIKQVLNNVKSTGLSPAFFASYERTEGYNSSWGWLNHTTQKGDYFQDATSVSNVVITQSNNMSGNPSWIDYGNPVDFVPSSVKNEGNQHFSTLSKGTIGRALIPLTAAATWEVYYPNGLLKEYNKIQDYAKPINLMVDTIIAWGGSFNGTIPDPDPDHDPDLDPNDGIDVFKFITDLKKVINNMLSKNVYHMGISEFYKNEYLKLSKQMGNTYQIKANKKFFDIIDEKFNDFNNEYVPPDSNPDPDPDPDPDPEPTGEFYFPVNTNQAGINFWKRSNWGVGSLQRNMTYGTRSSGKFHAGYDIGSGGNNGYKIHAVRDGTVTHVETRGTAGFVIAINHSTDDYHTLYMHLVTGSNTVNVGDTVIAGQHIATMGATGGNYAVHLHIELSKTGQFHKQETTEDPEHYLRITKDNTTTLKIPN